MYDVTIIGGGVIGCAIARELTRYRLKTILLEKACEVGFGTSKSNSGVIHAGHHTKPNTLKGRLEWQGNQMWDALHDDLGFSFRRIGDLTVAFDDEEISALYRLQDQGRQKGVPGLDLWYRERIRRAEPNLNKNIVAALYAPTSAVVNPYEACFALIENAQLNGLEVHTESPVVAIKPINDHFQVYTDSEVILTRFIVNAAGLYADEVAAMVGAQTFTLSPRRGEEYLLDKRLIGFVKHTIFSCPTPISKGILIIPTFDGTLMVGPTAIDSDKDDTTTTLTGAEEVFAAVKHLAPGISERDCIAEFAGVRAVADNDDFIIEPTLQRGFVNVAGIQSPGLTAAPAVALMVVEMLHGDGLKLELNQEFKPTLPRHPHFSFLPIEEQFRLARQDSRYSHVVCRCEQVYEMDVLDAIERGARTLDGVKLRTRAGMGRCQGSFCTIRCMQLLSEKLNVPMTHITKRGAGSWLICDRAAPVENPSDAVASSEAAKP